MSELVYVQELWRKRAEVAQECADELGELAGDLQALVRRNYFGVGCEEGVTLFDRLGMLLQDGSTSLIAGRTSAAALARTARTALIDLEEADSAGQHYVS